MSSGRREEQYALRRKVCAEVDAAEAELVQFLRESIRIPTENPPAEYEPFVSYLLDRFTSWGLNTSVVRSQDGKPSVLGVLPSSCPQPRLIYLAHLDTVPAGNPSQWTYDPFSATFAGGRIFGRGAVDCKGRLAAYAMAGVVLLRLGISLRGSLVIAATCDEETGGDSGAGYLTSQGELAGDFAIVEGYSERIVRATSGSMWIRITAIGKSAHAAWKWRGRNAIEDMSTIITALQNLQVNLAKEKPSIDGIRGTTLCVSMIAGGTKANIVPDRCVATVDFRIMPGQSIKYILERLDGLVAELRRTDPELNVEFEVLPEMLAEPSETPADAVIIQHLNQAAVAVLGTPLPVCGMPGQSDARWLIAAKTPSINYGPGKSDSNVHGIDENIEIADLVSATKVLAVLPILALGTDM